MKMPVLFIGHGSPMNIIENNPYTRSLAALSEVLPKPKAILVVSAHWQTRNTYVTAAALPPTIYDFYGFPENLYEIQYACPGSPETAQLVQAVTGDLVRADQQRGIDHAAWAVLKHVFPQADIPVLELSLDRLKTPSQHYELGRRLAPLRDGGVLIIGSGNIVHNLAKVRFEELYGNVDSWALEFDHRVAELMTYGDHGSLINYDQLPNARWAIPTNEHYLPLLYTLALQEETDMLQFTCTDMQNGSISMRSLMLSQK